MGESQHFFPKSHSQAKQELEQVIHRSPRLFGWQRSRWWLEGLKGTMSWFEDLSLPGIWKQLKRLGLSYKRGREYLHSPDTDYDLKLSYVQTAYRLAQESPEHIVLLYQDELTYYRRASVARGYARVASKDPRAIQGLKSNNTRRISGCLNAISGQFTAWQRSRFTVKTLIRFYRHIIDTYPYAETIFLVQDNWPVHFHPDILMAIQDSPICLLRLPTYAPWTNPIEKVWLLLKQQLLHMHEFADDWQALQDAVQHWLDHCDDNSTALLHAVGLSPY